MITAVNLIIETSNMDELQCIMLRPTQKATYYIIPFIWHFGKGKLQEWRTDQ